MSWTEKVLRAANLRSQADRLLAEADRERCPAREYSGERCTADSQPDHVHTIDRADRAIGEAWGVR